MGADVYTALSIGLSTLFILVSVIACRVHKRHYDELCEQLESRYKRKEKELEERRIRYEQSYQNRCNILDKQEATIKSLLVSSSPFKDVAKMAGDAMLNIFSNSANFLKNKRRPAPSAAQEVRAMRKTLKEFAAKYKEMEYKYDYILLRFPEIAEYIEQDEDLMAVAEHVSYNELIEDRDARLDYLSREEYNMLSETEKSKRALERYLRGRKSRWQIGRDYEMSCAMQLQNDGYSVELHGIKYGVKDLGRDLIATKQIGGLFGGEILIIQCKNWSASRMIHENVIMQLCGTAIEYEISNPPPPGCKYTPVLMVPPTSVVSETATQFANKLNIRIERLPNIDFPRIKCNINGIERIYHLPFDQQYDRTEIKNKGEFYAWTVEEAEEAGFRRARKHFLI